MIRPALVTFLSTPGFALGAVIGVALALPALAVGPEDDTPPTPTQTTTICAEGMVWDQTTQACIAIQDSRLDHDALIGAARELAYADRHADAIALLQMAADPDDSMVLTYLGFSHRSAGRMDTGLGYYDRALTQDPDNLLARAYMGMAFVQLGREADAQVQLAEIRARGGAGGWPGHALAAAIRDGDTSAYDY